jgi:hypothetical protein
LVLLVRLGFLLSLVAVPVALRVPVRSMVAVGVLGATLK